jgi:predicted PurR-regulated permease PerM
VLFLVAGALFLVTIFSTLSPLLLGAILAAVTQPLHRRLRLRLHGRNLSAAAMTLLLLLAVLLPLGGLVWALVERLSEALARLASMGWLQGTWQKAIATYPVLGRLVPTNLGAQLAAAIRFLAGSLPELLAGIANRVVALFLTVIATFYFLRDAEWVFQRVERALPLEPRHTRAVADEFKRVGRAVILGTVGTALLQGTAAGVAYWAVGLHEPLLLGALTAIAALVPVVGTSLVLVPATLYLLATGEILRAILLLGAGLFVVGVVDNLVRPLLGRHGLEVHPLLSFLAIFGGLATFGISGLYLGPLFVALFLAVVRIYESELASTAAAPAPPPQAAEHRLARALSEVLRRTVRQRTGPR